MISLEERVRKPVERFHHAKMTQSSLLKYLILNNKPHPDPKEKSIYEKIMVVEQSNTPMNGSMEGLAEEIENCHPEVP
jgi:hypothetical protein